MRDPTRGFTLLEIMVTLAVLAVAMGALIQGGSQSAAASAHIGAKSFGHWVAMNRVAELQLQPQWPEKGERRGEVTFGGRNWQWQTVVSDTFDDAIRRVEVSVAEESGREFQRVTRLSAFIAEPRAQVGP
ncbi:MAG: type II secretion system minor pseudopilin GspI [Gammaproteobacteria bacterium]|nr:type II secretion system minor pseudopilin GspI [Gammaproteobacteria bacterium]